MSTTSSLEGNYSPPSLDDLPYGDSTSSIYPDRPIRPLPKRRLRSRVSPEFADSILFPNRAISSAAPAQTAGKDSKSHSKKKGDVNMGRRAGQVNDSYQFRGSELNDEALNGVRPRTSTTGLPSGRSAYVAIRQDDPRLYRQAHMPPPIPPSAASSADSVDGYDSFENTNNKKKRKIPISGSLSNHQSSLSADMAQMDISSTRNVDVSSVDPDDGVGQYYGSGSSAAVASSYGSGILTSRKERSGRPALRRPSGRSPLGVSFNGPNGSFANRPNLNSFSKEEGSSLEGSVRSNAAAKKSPRQGIISAAIANAAAMPSPPSRGQEDVSLLEQQSFKKPSSSKTQFTFVCESDSAKSMTWPGYGYSSSGDMHSSRTGIRGGGAVTSKASPGFSTQGTQTSPSMTDQPNQATQAGTDQQGAQQPRKPRRSLAKQLKLAERDRKMRQEIENFKNPQKPEKRWICDFCEYEMIFGEPPRALIRSYEIKDRSERRRLAEKRRLLEKAKMKNRKGKKGNKNKNQNAAQTQQQNPKAQNDAQSHDLGAMQSQETQSDEQALDDYDDDPYSPKDLYQAQPTPKNTQPMAQAKNHLVRPPAANENGSGGVSNRAA